MAEAGTAGGAEAVAEKGDATGAAVATGRGADAKGGAAAGSWDDFYGLNPDKILLVLHKGVINLFDQSLYDRLAACHYPLHEFYKIRIHEKEKYVRGDLPGLMRAIRDWHPSVVFPGTATD